MTPFLDKSQTSDDDQKTIVGKWKMIKMEVKDGFCFDVSNKDSSFERFLKVVVDSLPCFSNAKVPKTLTEEDYISIKSDFEKAFNQFQQLYIEFKSDNAFITNQSRCKDISTLVNGTFSIDTKNRTLSRFENGQKTEDVYYELLDKLLTLRHKENSSSTIVLEKTE